MKPTVERICEIYNKAYGIKSTWDTEYREIFEYCMPARDGYQKAIAGETPVPEYQDRREFLYSSVGEQSATEFVNTMQELIAPPMADWISIEAGVRFDDDERADVNTELAKINKHANEYKANSNFDMAFSEFLYDLFAGTACMLITEGATLATPINFTAVPLREYCLEEGAHGEVRGVFRKYEMKSNVVTATWKQLKGKVFGNPDNPDEKMSLIESAYYDYDEEVWHYQVIDEKNKAELLAEQSECPPFIAFRWNKMSGEYYGRGVGMTSINDIKTLNLIKYYSLRNLAFNTPPLLVQEDDMLDVESLELTPWSLNVVPDTQNSIVPLQLSTNYDIEGYKTQELEMQIKKDTYGQSIPEAGAKDMTAYEYRQRKIELQRRVGAVAGRILSEWQIPATRRIFEVLMKGEVFGREFNEKFKIREIDGFKYKVNIITPMGRIIKQGEAQAIMAIASQYLQYDPTGRALNQAVKVPEMLYRMGELSGMPKDLLFSPDEIRSNINKTAQADAEAQAGALQADVATANAKELGKAQAQEAVK